MGGTFRDGDGIQEQTFDLSAVRRVGPPADLDADAGEPDGADDSHGGDPTRDREPEPWELPPPVPRAPQLQERRLEDVFDQLRALTLDQARAFLREYGAVSREGAAPPSMAEVARVRAILREGARREAVANGADEPDGDRAPSPFAGADGRARSPMAGAPVGAATPVEERARAAVVDALVHASLKGGELEEATLAAEVAAQDVATAFSLRPWISPWRFDELVEPWVRAYAPGAGPKDSFDLLGALALALVVLAFTSFTFGRGNFVLPDLWALAFGLLATLVLIVRYRSRSTPA